MLSFFDNMLRIGCQCSLTECSDIYAPASPVEEALLLARLLEDGNGKSYGWKDAALTLPLVNHSVILYVTVIYVSLSLFLSLTSLFFAFCC